MKISRYMKVVTLSVLLGLIPVNNSKAALAGVMAIFGSPAAGAVALAGLGSAGVGWLMTENSKECDGGTCALFFLIGGAFGIILLDEESGQIEFSEIEMSKAKDLGVTTADIESYNKEIAEVNLVFSEVVSELSHESSVEEAKELWSDYESFLSVGSMKTLRAIVQKK